MRNSIQQVLLFGSAQWKCLPLLLRSLLPFDPLYHMWPKQIGASLRPRGSKRGLEGLAKANL